MSPRPAPLLAAAAILCLCAGSRPHFTVKDTSNYEAYLDKVMLEGTTSFTVKQGETIIQVPFRNVKSVTIHQDEAITYGRESWYMAEVELRSGDLIGTENTAKDKTYLRVSGALTGRMGKSTVRLNLSQIASIKVE